MSLIEIENGPSDFERGKIDLSASWNIDWFLDHNKMDTIDKSRVEIAVNVLKEEMERDEVCMSSEEFCFHLEQRIQAQAKYDWYMDCSEYDARNEVLEIAREIYLKE